MGQTLPRAGVSTKPLFIWGLPVSHTHPTARLCLELMSQTPPEQALGLLGAKWAMSRSVEHAEALGSVIWWGEKG